MPSKTARRALYHVATPLYTQGLAPTLLEAARSDRGFILGWIERDNVYNRAVLHTLTHTPSAAAHRTWGAVYPRRARKRIRKLK